MEVTFLPIMEKLFEIKINSLWKNQKTGRIVRVVERIKDGLLRVEYSKGLVHKIPDRILMKKFDPINNINTSKIQAEEICKESGCNLIAAKNGYCANHWYLYNENKVNNANIPEIEKKNINAFEYIGSVLKQESIPNEFKSSADFVSSFWNQNKKQFHGRSIENSGLFLMANIIHDLRLLSKANYKDFLDIAHKKSVEMNMAYNKSPRMLLKIGNLPWDISFEIPASKKHVRKSCAATALKLSEIEKRKKKLLDELEKLNRFEQSQKSQLQNLANQIIKLTIDLGYSKGWISKPSVSGFSVKVGKNLI